MNIPLDHSAQLALYRQIDAWIRRSIRRRQLAPGTRLPSVRELAASLGVSRITAQAAYDGLVADGLIETRGRAGSFVAARAWERAQATADGGPAGPNGPDGPATPNEPAHPGAPGHPGASGADLGLGRGATSASRAAAAPRAASASRAPLAIAGGSPRLIDLSSGCGDDALFPMSAFIRSIKARDPAHLSDRLGYAPPGGEPGLRAAIARGLASRGLAASPEDILVTGGSQQALALCAWAFAPRGGVVLVEEPSYAKGLAMFRAAGLRPVALACDADGPLPEALEASGASGESGGSGADVAFAYLMPSYRNPDGASYPYRRRVELVQAAARRGIPIVEDDYVGQLRYEGRAEPSLWNLAAPGGVVYTGTFSKLLAPGLQVGFVAAAGRDRERLAQAAWLFGMGASRPFQQALASFIGAGAYRAHLRRASRLYQARRNALAAALARRFPELRFTLPAGGLFLWVALPEPRPGFAAACQAAGVLVAPAEASYLRPPPDASRFYRLNFARLNADLADEAAGRLAQAYRASGRAAEA